MDCCGPARRAAHRRGSAATRTTPRWWPARRGRRPLERRHVGACPVAYARAAHYRRRRRLRPRRVPNTKRRGSPLLFY